MSQTIVCVCGVIHWGSARLRQLHAYLVKPRTSREAADRFGWSVQNVNAKMHALEALGLASHTERVQSSGGVEYVWTAKHASTENEQ
jgi:hypothetical protein